MATNSKNGMNLLIAKTHRLSGRLIGMQITMGTFIGIVLSAIQMSAGFLIVGQALIGGSFFLAVLIVLIGAALALLVERLSIGGLAAVRGTSEQLKRLRDDYYGMLRQEKRQAEEFEQKDFERQEKEFKQSRRMAIVFAVTGILLSAGLGDVFWHFLFNSLGVVGYILSASCAAVISLTFIHSELYRALMNGVLREILADMHLMKVAVGVEGQQMQLDMTVDAYEAVRYNEQVRAPAQARIEKTVAKQLTNFAVQVEAVGNQVASYNNPNSLGIPGTNQLLLPPPRGKYHLHRAELLRLLNANPQLSDTDAAKHFGISRSTANTWIKKARAGQ